MTPLKVQAPAPTCDEPFESGPKLCKHCRLTADEFGLRRCGRVVAESPEMQSVMKRVARIAGSDAPVVILGESGTGKEVVARTIHANSPRRSRKLVAVNVGAIPQELLESELFGHARGAFTGATDRKVGLFEEADGGTLFLDELAEMPLPLQVKLLRVLQDGEVRRVGEARPFQVDVRILCATHRDLAAMVQTGPFRQDLYYRLKVFTVMIPPLRERRDDVAPLVAMFLEQADRAPDSITPRALEALRSWRWPGNIRELSNAVQHAVVLAGDERIEVAHLPDEIARPTRDKGVQSAIRGELRTMSCDAVPASSAPGGSTGTLASVMRPLAEVEREHVLRVIEACGGNQVEAARVLAISRTTLWRKLRDYGVA